MASTFTTNTHLELQGTGDNSGTWGTVLNSAAFTIIDNVFGVVQTISVGSSPVTISTTQSQSNYVKFTGTLTADVTVTFPAIGRTYFLANNTTGNFTLTIACAGAGNSAVLPRGMAGFFVLDATNVKMADVYFGALTDLAGGTTISLGTITSRNINVTGSGWNCTSFGSVASTVAPVYLLTFASTGTLTYNATSMILPGAANISVAAGDTAVAMYLGSGNWRIVSYTMASVSPTTTYRLLGIQTFTASGTYTPTTGCRYVKVTVIGGGGGGGGGYYSGSGSANNAGGGGGEGATAIYYGTAGASSQTVTIGAGGAGGSGSATGTTGGTSSFGALAVAGGGAGGLGGQTTGIFTASRGGAGGTASAGTIQIGGADGGFGMGAGASGDDSAAGGTGGGRGGRGGTVADSGSVAGANGNGYGGGGGGGCRADTGSSVSGGTGASGFVSVEEYA